MTDPAARDDEFFLSTKAEMIRELHKQVVEGRDELIRELLGRERELSDEEVAEALHQAPWNVYWQFRSLLDAGAVERDEVDAAWGTCLKVYGEAASVAARDQVESAIAGGEDVMDAAGRNVPADARS